MIVPSDEDYVETKLIKLGKRTLSSTFQNLANWIAERYSVTVLNVRYDKIAGARNSVLPRLNVILEWERDWKKFRGPNGSNFDPERQSEIAVKFSGFLGLRALFVSTRHLFVVFSEFESVARLEAIWNVKAQEQLEFITSLANPAIWTTRNGWDGITIFSHTNAELEIWEAGNFKQKCSDAYAAILTPYDQFGYLQVRPATVTLDSKQNFDAIYKGNWSYYDRR